MDGMYTCVCRRAVPRPRSRPTASTALTAARAVPREHAQPQRARRRAREMLAEMFGVHATL